MNRLSSLLLLVAMGLSACSQDSGQTAEATYPSVPDDTVFMLWEKCDYIDFIFYNRSFSMSQDEQAQIRQTIRHISEATPVIDPACQPAGRIFFQVEGENALQGDFFFQDGCTYFLFYEDGEIKYANEMTPLGVKFYNYVFTQVGNSPEEDS
ncbi:MAG: hypothetical protein R3350_07170 [Saprospiraceae bacterium]|nr:hypothetical protein [Saprospiraceae bacterium]